MRSWPSENNIISLPADARRTGYNGIKPLGVSSMKAGSDDTFMATCLPLCDVFVTRDKTLLVCYREVVAVAGLNIAVRSVDDFTGQFLIRTNAADH